MDQCGGLHGIILISLLIILHLGLRSCQESFKPLHLELHTDPHDRQRLIVKWNISDSAYSPGLAVIFHIQVARSANKNIVHSVHYNTSLLERGETFSWSWDSELPLECDSHSIHIRSAVLRDIASYEWSGWSQWKTHHGRNEIRRNKIEIYPHEKIVLEGSDVISCCLPDLQKTVQSMEYDRVPYPSQSMQLKTDSFVIALRNVSITKSLGKNILCRVNDNKHHGTVLIVSRPPNEPSNFSCETNDLQKLLCRWTPGPRYNFYGRLAEKFTLQEGLSGKSTCQRETCTWPIVKNQQIYNFTLMVENRLGMKSINALVNLTERVRPVSPTNLMATHVTARGAGLIWSLSQDYSSLMLHCQTHLQDRTVNVTLQGKTSRDWYSLTLTKLQPFTEYKLRVRCRSQSSLAGWSDWSDILPVRTREDVPSGPVDIWREIQDDDAGQVVTLYWKHPPDFNANGILSHYNITWWQTGGNMSSNDIIPAVDQNIYRLHIGRQACVISVTANNSAGMSPAAEIKIPGASVSGSEMMMMNTERAHGRDGGVAVWWRADPAASGYVVEWCSSPQSTHCGLQWKKYNASVHSDVIHSEAFQGGVRYDFKVYASREDGEHLLGKLTGYSEELAPSKKPKVEILKVKADSVSLDWSPYPVEEESQKGFITGYTIYVKNEGGDCEMEESNGYAVSGSAGECQIFIRDPRIMTTTISGLKASKAYKVSVVAVTRGGETEKEFRDVVTPLDEQTMIWSFLLPVVIVMLLGVALLILGCWKREWLKAQCYPDIPQPNKSKVLSFTSPKGHSKVMQEVNCVAQKVELVQVVESGKDHDLKDISEQQMQVTYSTIQKPSNMTCSETTNDAYSTNNNNKGSYINYANKGLLYPPTEDLPYKPMEDLLYKPIDDLLYKPTEDLLYKTTEDPLYRTQSPVYRQFFNQNYTGTPDDTLEDDPSSGYRPQTSTTMFHQSSLSHANHTQYTSIDDGPDLRATSFDSVAGCENEPMSPTSVTSTSFILVD